ncbi:MAG: hypothetical protein NC935_01945 [Candidatus Omnitrophica bacterium]|nr:hypothetical protein [Candidatus Omnitrophota bacterium]
MEIIKKYKNIIILIFLSLIFFSIAFIRLQFVELDHGDEFADANVLTAGKNFAKFGFIKCKFLPHFTQQLYTPKDPYLHYPPLPEIINGFLQKVFKVRTLFVFRAISIFFSFLNFIFFYLFIKKLTGLTFFATLAGIFFLVNPYFIFGMDSLHQMAFADFFRTLILFCFVSLDKIESNKKKFLFFLWILFFIESLLTFEYIIYLVLFFILYKYFLQPKKDIGWGQILFLFSAPISAFLLHFLQNVWYFGDFDLALADFGQIAKERILQSKDMPLPNFNFFGWWNYVIVKYFNAVFVFNYFLLFFTFFLSYVIYQNLDREHKVKIKFYCKLFFVFILCGISWYVVFSAHSFAHAFVPFLYRHIVPAAALWFSIFFYLLYIYANIKRSLISKLIVSFVFIFVIFSNITASELPISVQKRKSAQDFLVFKDCLLKLKNISLQDDLISTNYYRFPFMRWYLDRNVLPIFDKETLETLTKKPRYFIFLPYNNQRTIELFQYLEKEHQLLFNCTSSRFPSIFFKLITE